MSLLLRTHIKLARDSVRQNRVRSFLTTLGIAIGVAAIILILSLSGGIERLMTRQISETGADLIVIRPSSNKNLVDGMIGELTASGQYLKSNLALADVAIVSKLTDISAVAPLAVSESRLETTDKSVPTATIVATTPELAQIINLPLKTGQFLNSKLRPNTIVVGHTLALDLFGTAEAVGKTVTLNGTKLMVVGVLAKLSDPINLNNLDFDHSLLLNADFAEKTFGSLQIQQINVKVATTDALNTSVENIKSALSAEKSGDQNFSVMGGDEISHPAGSLFSIISAMLSGVAGISLIVGGIGIMNIMLVSVAERTREIGIRKAVGASSGNILLQFLFESLILSLMGGLLGFALGYAAAFLVSLITPFDPYISLEIVALTLITALLVGVLFGLYPALKAARKDPITSLKYYR
jgi:ABC-type antimicrobial peptide transport system permease subunit